MSADVPDRPLVLPLSYFLKVKNVGDRIAPDLVSRLFGYDVRSSTSDRPHLISIGSRMSEANRHSLIWGTGVMHPSLISPDVAAGSIRALRGKLSYEALRSAGVPLRDVPLGDPGFLVREAGIGAGQSAAERRYPIGLCPHYMDRGDERVLAALRDPDIADLDVHLEPGEFIDRMSQCDVVVSSSLHGLIFAESLAIPNVWIEFSDKVVGDGFKFQDWFSMAAVPQTEPCAGSLSVKEAAKRAVLHDVRIDTAALKAAFPHEAAVPAGARRMKSISACRQRPPPVFILSFSRPSFLRSCIATCRRLSPASDMVVHDFGSEDDETREALVELERDGARIVRDRRIEHPDELNRVDQSVAEYFDDWAEPGRYVITDCDVDMSAAAHDAMTIYDSLLDRFPKAGCVGPMLTVIDILPSYPLYSRVMNKQIEKFWSMKPEWTSVRAKRIAYQMSRIDTTFALHRAGSRLSRPKPGIRVYYPYEARHLDWYNRGSSKDAYGSLSSNSISHWNNETAVMRHGNEPLRFTSLIVVDRDQGTGELVSRDVQICAPGAALPTDVSASGNAS